MEERKMNFAETKRLYEQGYSPVISFASADGSTILKRKFERPIRLIILGGGYVGQAVCKYAADLGFAVIVVDDRKEFANSQLFPKAAEIICKPFCTALEELRINENDYVVVATRGHQEDTASLRFLLNAKIPETAYLGVLGSKKRMLQVKDLLEEEGYDRTRMERMHTPIGLAIHALTTDEIGISIVAQLIQCRREGEIRKKDILEQTNTDMTFLEYAATDEEKVIAVVSTRYGSSPVKTGAIMAVDRQLHTYGTIGGGAGEYYVIREIEKLFFEKTNKKVYVKMDHDVARDEGMACGGSMTVELIYLPKAPKEK